MKVTKLSFVIPVYNEEKRISKTFKALEKFKAPAGVTLREIIFVNDGSKDNTFNILQDQKQALKKATGANIVLINIKKNRGKGYAVKKGMLTAKYDYALFFDADMATPLSELKKFVPYFKNNTNIIIGTRKNGESTVEVHQPFYREFLGKCFTYLTNFTLNTWVTDFTCGFKAFSKDAKNKVFKQSKIERWGYDAEILFISKKLNYDIKEVAVRWLDDKDTKVELFKTIFTTLKELYTIRKNQITKVYNFKNSNKKSKQLLVVSSYPEKDLTHGEKTVGVASYTKNTLLHLKKYYPNIQITVFAEELFKKKERYVEEGIEVRRVWKRNSFRSMFWLISQIMRAPQKSVMLEFEMYMLGSLPKTVFFIAMLPFIYFTKDLTVVLHQVVNQVDSFEKNRVKKLFFKVVIPLFYRYIKLFSKHVVVFEGALKQRLGNGSKVLVVPHAVESTKTVSKKQACKKLGLNPKYTYFLYFGFISPYKGVLELIESWEGGDKNKLVIAGGINPNYTKNKPHVDYFKKVKSNAKKKGVIVTGFLPEEMIKYYYGISDVIVLPYKTFMSSSGPLSLAFSNNKALILSSNLTEYFYSTDISTNLKKSGIKSQNIVFDFDSGNKIDATSYTTDIAKVSNFSKLTAQSRSWAKISKQYADILND